MSFWQTLVEPLSYGYMVNAIWVSALIGGVCAFLSCFLMLKGWSLIGDALSHAIIPGVAGAYMLSMPFSVGAFLSGLFAAGGMFFLNRRTQLKEDVIIGLVFTAFFSLGLFMISLSPSSVNLQIIMQGNVLAITPKDTIQLVIIVAVTFLVLICKWKDLLLAFFDETMAYSAGLRVTQMKIVFFTLLSACAVAAMETVGAFLVIALIVTPGATAYLLSDKFSHVILLSIGIGMLSSALGAYASYFIDGATGAIIVLLQTVCFLLAFFFAPKHGRRSVHRRAQGAVGA